MNPCHYHPATPMFPLHHPTVVSFSNMHFWYERHLLQAGVAKTYIEGCRELGLPHLELVSRKET